jgi:hypothetical protein
MNLVKIKASGPWQHLPARAKRIEPVMQPFATQRWSRRDGQSTTDDVDRIGALALGLSQLTSNSRRMWPLLSE